MLATLGDNEAKNNRHEPLMLKKFLITTLLLAKIHASNLIYLESFPNDPHRTAQAIAHNRRVLIRQAPLELYENHLRMRGYSEYHIHRELTFIRNGPDQKKRKRK
jgi:hypothetical protein